jgi:hypothetical protein
MTASSTCDTTFLPKADDCPGLLGVVEIGTPMFYAIDFPELQFGQFAVCSLEISDDKSCPPDGQKGRASQSDSNFWQVVDSYEAAHQLAVQNVIAKPGTESVIYDSNGRQMHTVRNGQPVPLEVLMAGRTKPKNWWQFWKE